MLNINIYFCCERSIIELCLGGCLMKIEKLNENRIRFTFNHSDLQENNIDIHSFMSNSIESQSLFLTMLEEAEREVGFVTDNYKLSIEAIALTNGTFIITVTRIEKELLKSTRVQAHRKNNVPQSSTLIYQFASFDDFCNFQDFLTTSLPHLVEQMSQTNSLYQYQNCFFLTLENLADSYIQTLSSAISEFAVCVENSDLILNKIKECGKLMTENAIHTR